MDPVGLLHLVFRLLYLLLILRVVLSWVPGVNYYHPVVHFVYRITSPILDPIRRALPPIGGLDLSPLVAILLLGLLQQITVQLLIQLL